MRNLTMIDYAAVIDLADFEDNYFFESADECIRECGLETAAREYIRCDGYGVDNEV